MWFDKNKRTRGQFIFSEGLYEDNIFKTRLNVFKSINIVFINLLIFKIAFFVLVEFLQGSFY